MARTSEISRSFQDLRAVADSFAQSVLAGFKVEAASGTSVLVDATDFFLTDMHGVSRALSDAKQGNYAVDKNRSAIYLDQSPSIEDMVSGLERSPQEPVVDEFNFGNIFYCPVSKTCLYVVAIPKEVSYVLEAEQSSTYCFQADSGLSLIVCTKSWALSMMS